MTQLSVIVLGGTGLIGSAVCARFRRDGHQVLSINSKNYSQHVGAQADLLINCNGNPYRYKAERDPRWDFEASVLSVENSLFDFKVGHYFYFSSIDVYNHFDDPERNHEGAVIEPQVLHPYGFHKWLAERLVEKFASDFLILRCGTVLSPGVKKGPLFDLVHNAPLRVSVDSEFSLIEGETMSAVVAALAAGQARPSSGEAVRAAVKGRVASQQRRVGVAAPEDARAPRESSRIINLTGTGSASLRRLCAAAGLSWRLATGAGQNQFRYNINNTRLSEIMPVPASHDVGLRFLGRARQLRL